MNEPINDAAGLQRLNAALLDARRELIDLSRRNRLLHTSRTGKRPHCLEIINADPDAVFVAQADKRDNPASLPVTDDNEWYHQVGEAEAVLNSNGSDQADPGIARWGGS